MNTGITDADRIKFTIVIGMLNQFHLTKTAVREMVRNLAVPEETEVIVIDNGSDRELPMIKEFSEQLHVRLMRIVRNDTNTGNYPLFKQGRELAHGEIVAFLHSDVFVYEKGWDVKVRAQFDRPDLGLVGFIGSTELDNFGGRGSGTVSNMIGRHSFGKFDDSNMGAVWSGSEAEVHGRRDVGFIEDGAVVDGCVMIFRKSVLDAIEMKPDFPPHHFYDRMMSVQVIEAGYKVGILGIEFDHVSGQVANHEQKWADTARAWCEANLGIGSPQEWTKFNTAWMQRADNPSRGQTPSGWDHVIYLEAEKRFLQEYRDQKRIVPLFNGRRIN